MANGIPGTRITAREIEREHRDLQPHTGLPTPLEYSPWLSDQVGGEVYLKRETFRETRTSKVRGAFHFLLQVTEEQRRPTSSLVRAPFR